MCFLSYYDYNYTGPPKFLDMEFCSCTEDAIKLMQLAVLACYTCATYSLFIPTPRLD